MTINQELINQLSQIKDPKDLILKVFQDFGEKAAIGTSGQLTGTVMIDMACQSKIKPRVFTLDTLRLFKETYTFFDAVEKKYNIEIEKYKPDPQELDRMIKQHGKHLFFDSKEKQEYCCHVRKVKPNLKALESIDVWLTGLRADQSENRSKTPKFEIIHHDTDKHPILKIAPLVDWTEEELRNYIKQNNCPIHELLEWELEGWYYESIGCRICTTPIGPHEPRRAGRWRWFNATDSSDKKECGIHIDGHDE